MSVINSHVQAAADMLILTLYLKNQREKKIIQKDKDPSKESIPWVGETWIHIHNIHLDPPAVVMMAVVLERTF